MISEFESYNKKNIDAIKEHFKFKSFKFPYGNKFLSGGKLICIHCGKEFKWEDWGRGKSRALTLAMKHIYKVHKKEYFIFSPYALKEIDVFYSAYPEAKL